MAPLGDVLFWVGPKQSQGCTVFSGSKSPPPIGAQKEGGPWTESLCFYTWTQDIRILVDWK